MIATQNQDGARLAMSTVAEILSKAVEDGVAAGLAVAWLRGDGSARTAAGGTLGAGDDAPMRADSVFWIASMSKAVTATAALQLVEQGKLELDAPVGRLLPALADPLVITGFDAEGRAQTRPARSPITLRHLLGHTSGLGYDFCSDVLMRNQTSPAPVGDPVLLFDPGEGWQYGVGLDWTGQLVEAASGAPFADFVRANITGPLGMQDTTFFPGEAFAGRAAAMHARLPDGGLAKIPFGLPPEPYPAMGGGGLYSTPLDYVKFLRAMLKGGGGLLSPQTVALMFAPLASGPHVGVLRSTNPAMSNDFDAFPDMSKSWGLAFMRNDAPGPAGRSAGSHAWAGLSNCYYWLDPEAGVAGVLMAQVLPFADPRVLEVLGQFETAVYAGAES